MPHRRIMGPWFRTFPPLYLMATGVLFAIYEQTFALLHIMLAVGGLFTLYGIARAREVPEMIGNVLLAGPTLSYACLWVMMSWESAWPESAAGYALAGTYMALSAYSGSEAARLLPVIRRWIAAKRAAHNAH